MNRSSQDSILLECLDIWRPIRERKVGTSGTKGVGDGIAARSTFLWRHRVQCWEAVKVFRVRRREGREEKRADGFRRAMMAVLVVMVGGGVRFDGQDLICRENRSHGVDGYVIFFPSVAERSIGVQH